MTRQEATALIESFLAGSSSPWEWDDFTSVVQQDAAVERARRKCVDIRDEYPPTVSHEYYNSTGREVLRRVATELRESAKIVAEANTIVADALEAEANLQEEGDTRKLGESFERTYQRVLEIDQNYGEAIAFAFTLWDEWADAARHDWQYHDPLTEADWLRFARQTAAAVREGRVPDNEFLVEQILQKPPRDDEYGAEISVGDVAFGTMHDECFFSLEPASMELKRALIDAVLALHSHYLGSDVDWSMVVLEILDRWTLDRALRIRSSRTRQTVTMRWYESGRGPWAWRFAKPLQVDCSSGVALLTGILKSTS